MILQIIAGYYAQTCISVYGTFIDVESVVKSSEKFIMLTLRQCK